jgi:hypothetical protein
MLATEFPAMLTHANGVTAPSAGADVALNTIKNPFVAVVLVAYTPNKFPAAFLITRLLTAEADDTGTIADPDVPDGTTVTGHGWPGWTGTNAPPLAVRQYNCAC